MNSFEEACNELEKDRDMGLENENVIEFIRNSKTATVCFTQGRYINKIKELKKKFPDQIEICHEKENLIVAHIPTSSIRISILTGREMTEEEKEAARERLKKYREEQEKKEG